MKIILFISFCLLSMYVAFAQTFSEEQWKYWYYRDRLKYFVYPGSGEGCSVIMTARNANRDVGTNYPIYNSVEYGQTYKLMGYYIGMLATEYKLLTSNGQYAEAANTLNELNLALDALIRMDKCEDIVPWYQNEELDGFFIRHDVPPIISSSMTEYLNQDLLSGDYNAYIAFLGEGYRGKPFGIENNVVDCSQKYENQNNYFYNHYALEFDLNSYLSGGTQYWKHWKSDKFTSNDEIIGVMMGLSLVVKYVNDPIVLSKAVALELIMREFAIGRFIPPDSWDKYRMFYPDGSKISERSGGYSISFFYGINEIVRNLLPGYYDSDISALLPYTVGVSLYGSTSSLANFYNRGLYLKLISISNNAGLLNPYISINKIGDDANLQVFYLLLWADINNIQIPSSQAFYPFDKLLFDLETAPCGGPFKYEGSITECSINWACEYKYDAKINVQRYGGDHLGVFPGLDYMLLYNLACLAFPNGFEYNNQHYSFPYYVNYNNREINGIYYPILLPNNSGPANEVGSIGNPEIIKAISTIKTNVVVSNQAICPPIPDVFFPGINGDVTLIAGERIVLTDGFRVDAGAHFLAKIESYSCGGLPYKNMYAPPWSENYRASFLDTLISIPMDQRPPIVYSEDDYVEGDWDEPLWNDYYFMYDSTTVPTLELSAWLSPNPCSSYTELFVAPSHNMPLRISLHDAGGHELMKLFDDNCGTTEFKVSIDLTALPQGIYFIRIQGNDGLQTLKIMRE